MKAKMLIVVVSMFISVVAIAEPKWNSMKGFNIGADLEETDFDDAAKIGANILRVSFTRMPLIDKESPYAMNQKSVEKLDKIIEWCRKRNIKIVLDPHTVPGTKRNSTTFPSDELWKSYEWHKYIIGMWGYLSARYAKDNDVIIAYDVLNEPSAPFGIPQSGPGDWNELLGKIIKEIRLHDLNTYIMIEPIAGRTMVGQKVNRIDGIKYLQPPKDRYLVVSPHIYEPLEFTRQGLPDQKTNYVYPGLINGVFWNKEKLKGMMEPIMKWQKEYAIPVFVGEFSVVRWSGESGKNYIGDLVDIFESLGWGWAYHEFRGAHMWDLEMSSDNMLDKNKLKSTNRLNVIKNAFQKN